MLSRWAINLVLVASLLFIPSTVACQTKWGQLASKVGPSVVFVSSPGSVCTGFVLDRSENIVLTAGHCSHDTMKVEDKPAEIIALSVERDLLILQVPGLDRPALRFSAKDPALGEELASVSFGHGLTIPLLRVFHVSSTSIGFMGFEGPYLAVDAPFMKGQSGGPVFNTKGEVVMISQGAADELGIGKGSVEILTWIRSLTTPDHNDNN